MKAFCTLCNNEIYVDSISDQNLQNLYAEYRKINNIISLSDIREIPEKYNIGKRPLSLLSGWGELTLTRY